MVVAQPLFLAIAFLSFLRQREQIHKFFWGGADITDITLKASELSLLGKPVHMRIYIYIYIYIYITHTVVCIYIYIYILPLLLFLRFSSISPCWANGCLVSCAAVIRTQMRGRSPGIDVTASKNSEVMASSKHRQSGDKVEPRREALQTNPGDLQGPQDTSQATPLHMFHLLCQFIRYAKHTLCWTRYAKAAVCLWGAHTQTHTHTHGNTKRYGKHLYATTLVVVGSSCPQ